MEYARAAAEVDAARCFLLDAMQDGGAPPPLARYPVGTSAPVSCWPAITRCARVSIGCFESAELALEVVRVELQGRLRAGN